MSDRQERKAHWFQLLQFAISVVVGTLVYIDAQLTPSDNPKADLAVGFLAGVAAAWLFTFCWVWARFGWKAARTMRWFG